MYSLTQEPEDTWANSNDNARILKALPMKHLLSRVGETRLRRDSLKTPHFHPTQLQEKLGRPGITLIGIFIVLRDQVLSNQPSGHELQSLPCKDSPGVT